MNRGALTSLVCLGMSASACSILFDARDQASNYAATRNDAAPGPGSDGGAPDGGGGGPDGGGPKDSGSGPDGGGPKDVGLGLDGAVADVGPLLCLDVDAGCIAPSSGGIDRSFDARGAGFDLRFPTLTCPIVSSPSFTIEFWIKYSYAGAVAVQRSIISQENATDGWNILLDVGPTTAGVAFQLLAGGVSQETRTSRTLTPDVWHHIAVEGTTTGGALVATIFLDGQVRPDRTFNVGAMAATGPTLLILGNAIAPYLIDELRISTVERYVHGVAFIPPKEGVVDANTLGRWLMDESDLSLVASDSTCRHHGSTARMMSFVTDAPM